MASNSSESLQDSPRSPEEKTWHWNCSAVSCKNSWRTKGVSYYSFTKLEKEPNHIREKYLKILGKAHNKVNWKREVICSGHWSKTRENLYDLPDIKYTTKYKDETAVKTNWHWNCCATLCNNSWRTTGVTYYKLSEVANDKKLKLAYEKILKKKKSTGRKASFVLSTGLKAAGILWRICQTNPLHIRTFKRKHHSSQHLKRSNQQNVA